MTKRYQNKRHLEWVHELDCLLAEYGGCDHNIQAHHLLKPWTGHRGMGLKANDRNVVPICYTHHHYLHMNGNEHNFFEQITGDKDFGSDYAELVWICSPHFEVEDE